MNNIPDVICMSISPDMSDEDLRECVYDMMPVCDRAGHGFCLTVFEYSRLTPEGGRRRPAQTQDGSTMKFLATGRLRYSPTLPNGTMVRRDGKTTKWWLVIDCDPLIGRYYRHLYHLYHWKTREIKKPSWEAHISIIANEQPPNEALWRKYDGQHIEFEYNHVAGENDIYVWLPVYCDRALDIRQELGLPRHPYVPLHMTIGNNKPQLHEIEQAG